MRTTLMAIASVMLVISVLVVALGVVSLIADAARRPENATILCGAVGCLLLSGCMWLLADIARSVAKPQI